MENTKIIRKLILTSLVKLLILIGIFGAVLSFLVAQLKSQASSLREKQTQMAIFQGREETKTKIEKDYKKIEPSLPKIMEALPKKDNLTKFLTEIEKIAPGLSIRFEETLPSPETLAFEIKLPGNLTNFLGFIKSLEDLPYNIKITGFDLTQTSLSIKATLAISSI